MDTPPFWSQKARPGAGTRDSTTWSSTALWCRASETTSRPSSMTRTTCALDSCSSPPGRALSAQTWSLQIESSFSMPAGIRGNNSQFYNWTGRNASVSVTTPSLSSASTDSARRSLSTSTDSLHREPWKRRSTKGRSSRKALPCEWSTRRRFNGISTEKRWGEGRGRDCSRKYCELQEEELYIFEPDELSEDPDETISARPAFAPPKDRLLADVLCEHPTAIVEYMQHDTLFQHIEEEKLNDKVGKRVFIFQNGKFRKRNFRQILTERNEEKRKK